MDIESSGLFQTLYDILALVIRIAIFAGIVSMIARIRNPKKNLEKPVTAIHVECTNCGLVNPTAWEKCERCGAPLATIPKVPPPLNDNEPPPLVKKI